MADLRLGGGGGVAQKSGHGPGGMSRSTFHGWGAAEMLDPPPADPNL